MSLKNFHLIFLLFFVLHQLEHSDGKNVVKAAYWSADSGCEAAEIDSTLFTHLFYAFAVIDSDTNKLTIPYPSISDFTETVQLKNPNVKTLLSMNGEYGFSLIARKRSSRKFFIDSSISMARSYGFSGLDLDWENQTKESEMENMALLLDELRAAIDAEASTSGATKLLLTSALPCTPESNSVNFKISSLKRNLDWINVMAYDFDAPDVSSVTQSHAALYDPDGQPSGSDGINAWINASVPANKLVLGLPFYGYPWKLVDSNDDGLSAPADGLDTSVGELNEDGQIGYADIKNFTSEHDATCVFNDIIVSDYCYSGTTWIGYDDTQSISWKVNYTRDTGLLGYFAWQVGYDSNSDLSTAGDWIYSFRN